MTTSSGLQSAHRLVKPTISLKNIVTFKAVQETNMFTSASVFVRDVGGGKMSWGTRFTIDSQGPVSPL